MTPSSNTPSSETVGLRAMLSILFCLLVTVLLYHGARTLEPYCLRLHALHSELAGAALLIAGAYFIVKAVIALAAKGKGSPFKAYPTRQFVSTGVYRIFPHPIYLGFCLIVAGTSIYYGSRAGFYIMFPLSILGCIAVVWGYERHELLRRFGKPSPRTVLRLPGKNERPALPRDKFRGLIATSAVWAVLYYVGSLSSVNSGGICSRLMGEDSIIPSEWCAWVYMSVFIVIPVFFILLRSNRDLREVMQLNYFCAVLGFLIAVTFPFSCPNSVFTDEAAAEGLMRYDLMLTPEHSISFPSFRMLCALPVFWYAAKYKNRVSQGIAFTWLALLAWSCVTLGMYGYISILGSVVIFVIVMLRRSLVKRCLKLANIMANSWYEYRFNRLRIINHFIYAFLAAATGFIVCVSLAGQDYLWSTFVVALCALSGAILWGLFIERAGKTLRKFGFNGAILGSIAGIFLVTPFVPSLTVCNFFGALAVTAPLIKAIGRLRCLVQGSCHGRPIDKAYQGMGITYIHPDSHVCKSTDWKYVPLHPTPLYSIAGSLVIFWFLIHLWNLHMPIGLIIGFYLILTGFLRFVEEAYRGEQHRNIHHGLTVSQWMCGLFVIGGFAVWEIRYFMIPAPRSEWSFEPIPYAILLGFIYAFFMSCDFPESNRRFSRLTSE